MCVHTSSSHISPKCNIRYRKKNKHPFLKYSVFYFIMPEKTVWENKGSEMSLD